MILDQDSVRIFRCNPAQDFHSCQWLCSWFRKKYSLKKKLWFLILSSKFLAWILQIRKYWPRLITPYFLTLIKKPGLEAVSICCSKVLYEILNRCKLSFHPNELNILESTQNLTWVVGTRNDFLDHPTGWYAYAAAHRRPALTRWWMLAGWVFRDLCNATLDWKS